MTLEVLALAPNLLGELKPHSVIKGMRTTALLLETNSTDCGLLYLYRPEKGITLTLDPRVPPPQELYRDVAYHNVDSLLGWSVSAPVTPWQLKKGDRGVLRPYWKDAQALDHYHVSRELFFEDYEFWVKVAVLDYICGVVDRGANDLLELDPGHFVVIDSGLSFVDGVDFVYDLSVVREGLKGSAIPDRILNDLYDFDLNCLLEKNIGLIDEENFFWFVRRVDQILGAKKVL